MNTNFQLEFLLKPDTYSDIRGEYYEAEVILPISDSILAIMEDSDDSYMEFGFGPLDVFLQMLYGMDNWGNIYADEIIQLAEEHYHESSGDRRDTIEEFVEAAFKKCEYFFNVIYTAYPYIKELLVESQPHRYECVVECNIEEENCLDFFVLTLGYRSND